MDSLNSRMFERASLPIETVSEVLAGANFLAYSGRLRLAGRDLDLAATIGSEWMPGAPGSARAGGRTLLGHLYRGHLMLALGAPTSQMAGTWGQVAERARSLPQSERAEVVQFGWPAAVGLFLADPKGSTSLRELESLGGGGAPPEVLAFAALDRGDSADARRLLESPGEPAEPLAKRPPWLAYRKLIAADVWHRLGDDARALSQLNEFRVESLSTEGLDVRWFLLGQARLLRGEIYETMNRPAEAKAEYRAALEQWSEADDELAPLVERARGRLGRLERAG
jgi:tetratricopeptide (TPR) repeat protein